MGSRIRICIKVKGRIQDRIKVKGRIRIRIKMKRRIRIRIKVMRLMRIRNTELRRSTLYESFAVKQTQEVPTDRKFSGLRIHLGTMLFKNKEKKNG
jgi:hypothetical protein